MVMNTSIVISMAGLGKVRVIYLGEKNDKKSVIGQGEDKGQYVEVKLNPSKKRTKFDTVLIPWARVVKVVIF